MKIVVTGAGGFIGSHLVDRLAERRDQVFAWHRPGSAPPSPGVPGVVADGIDLMRREPIVEALRQLRPDAICHLAAQSLPSLSWAHPLETMHNNIAAALNLCDAARDLGFSGPILIAGSSSEYAEQRDPAVPITEDHPIGSTSPYAASKIAVDQLSQLYHRRYGLAIIRMRPFFWIGTRKTGDFCSDMARKLVQVERGAADSIKVGNLDAVRDLLDVGDGVAGMTLLLERGRPGEAYNLCSGVGQRMRDVIDLLVAMSPSKAPVETDSDLLRPLDEPVRVGDPARAMALGWVPKRHIEESLRDILEYWRGQDT